MATFEEQVEGITGLTIGSSPAPSSNVFTDMLREGVRDVVNKMIVLRPEEIPKFTATTDSGAGTSVAKTGKILSVMREHASTSILRKCTLISPNARYEATDSDSLFYRSEINPGYYELNGSIHTVPVAAESGNNNVVVTQVTYDAGLVGGDTYGGGNIANFPTDYEHLVVLYSAIQCLQAAIANSVISLNISSPTTPVMTVISFTSTDLTYNTSVPSALSASVLNSPGITSTSKADISGDVPTYTKPTMRPSLPFSSFSSGLSETDPGTLTISTVPPVALAVPSFTTPNMASILIANAGIPPTYTAPTIGGATEELTASMTALADDLPGTDVDFRDFSKWFTLVGEYIEDNQDVELASSQLQKISTYINSYNVAVQNQLNIFNDANVEYQAKLQEGIQQAQINAQEAQLETSLLLQQENQEYTAQLQKYSAEVTTYQAEVGKTVQEYQTKLSQYTEELSTSVQAWQQEESTKIAQYQADIQNELNEFNKENARYQANIQAEITKAQLDAQEYKAEGDMALQASVQEYTNNLQKYQGDIARYSASVTADVQEFQQELASDVQSYQADVQDNNAKIAKYQAEVADYQAEVAKEIQENTTKVQQYQLLYGQLSQQYNVAFQVAQPQQVAKQERRR